ncbi:uncharacterized protein G2W53_038087 [Senna tora]|uniref:Uncharacterized protein n=1 Tax=Senna tora TaxID=362788 RepID=A0A834W4W1_9FABA|nr:uncharacterized protein G2W53_038087 [Senna tora]
MAMEDSLSTEILSLDLHVFPGDGRARRLPNNSIPATNRICGFKVHS